MQQSTASRPKLLLMGLRRSGKSSIQKVVFKKMSPNETLFLESTNKVERDHVYHSAYVQLEIWDFPGQLDLFQESSPASSSSPIAAGFLQTPNGGVDLEAIFGGVGALVFVIDAQDDYIESLSKLYMAVTRAYKINPHISFEVFIHKVDGLSDDHKIETQRDIHQRITDELVDSGLEHIPLSFYLTSIYDHSIFEAFSKVVQKLIPQLPTLENLLNILCSNSSIEKAFLFDVLSKIYIATDSSPVDMSTYELCSDMIDVVIDISCIYGYPKQEASSTTVPAQHLLEQSPTLQSSTPGPLTSVDRKESLVSMTSPHGAAVPSTATIHDHSPTLVAPSNTHPPVLIPFDDESNSYIRLNNGMVLYLREVSQYMALVCLLRGDNFLAKQGLVEYNFRSFREAIHSVFALREVKK